jgi:hypothetical protein
MGWQYDLGVAWPKERPSWTAAAVILAAEALEGEAAGADLLVRHARPDAWLRPASEIRAT